VRRIRFNCYACNSDTFPFITEQAQLLVGHDVQVSLTITNPADDPGALATSEEEPEVTTTTVAFAPSVDPPGATRPADDVRLIPFRFVEPISLRRRPVGRRNTWSCLQSTHDLRELRSR